MSNRFPYRVGYASPSDFSDPKVNPTNEPMSHVVLDAAGSTVRIEQGWMDAAAASTMAARLNVAEIERQRALPCETLQHHALVHELDGPPAVGAVVAVHARGRVRLAQVIKVTPTRALVEYAVPTRPGVCAGSTWFRRADVIAAPAPRPEHVVLGIGRAKRPCFARTWRVVHGGGNCGHTFEPAEVMA